MALICINNVPTFWNLERFNVLLAKNVKGQYNVLMFCYPNKKSKCAYVQLSEKLLPSHFIQGIERLAFKIKVRLTAKVVDQIPNNIATCKSTIKKMESEKRRTAAKWPPEQILFRTQREIIVELHSKYTGLIELSAKSDHKLFKEIAKTVFERLKHIMDTNAENAFTPFVLSKAYRKSYPHFGDFQMILSTLHNIEDTAGLPRTQVLEQALTKPPGDLNDTNFTHVRVQKIVQKYLTKIENKINEYMRELEVDAPSQIATPEEIAQYRVRVELKKMAPYMQPILRQGMTIHFHGEQKPLTANKLVRMKIYGEPFLPTRDHLEPIMSKYQAKKIVRSDDICNLVTFSICYRHYFNLMTFNGKEIGGAKLVVRPTKIPKYKMPAALMKYVLDLHQFDYDVPEVPEEEDMEDWGEEM